MSVKSARKGSVTACFILTFLISWASWIPFVVFGPTSSAITSSPQQANPMMLLQVLGNYGPTLAAVLLSAFWGERGEFKSLLGRLRPRRVSLEWYAVVLLLPLGVMLPGLLTYGLFGGALAELQFVAILPMFVASIFISGLGEELGWRGYVLSRLQERIGPLAASLVIGVLWGIWHLPIFYWASTQRGIPFLVEFALYVLFITTFSVLFTWVYNATNKSLWMVVLMHAAVTSAGNNIMVLISPGRVGSWVPYTVSLLSLLAAAILATTLGKSRVLSGQRTA